MGIAELVSDTRKEVGRLKEEIAELPRRISAVKESSANMSDFLIQLLSMFGWHETEIAGLRQARLGTPSATISREPAVNECDTEIRIDE